MTTIEDYEFWWTGVKVIDRTVEDGERWMIWGEDGDPACKVQITDKLTTCGACSKYWAVCAGHEYGEDLDYQLADGSIEEWRDAICLQYN